MISPPPSSKRLRRNSSSDISQNAARHPEGRRNPLLGLFSPKRIAVIGASDAKNSVGSALMRNLSSFAGSVYPVNPRQKAIAGKTSYSSVSALEETPDLAIIATPAESVPDIIAECSEAGVQAAIIISAGFRETGAHGCKLEQRILAAAQPSGMRVMGPNCLGLMLPHTGLNASFAACMARPGNVAFLSQSGALCTAVLDWSLREKVGFSAFVSLGSMLDLGWSDLIDFLADDPNTKSIVCYMESVGNARAFLSAARAAAFTKPIIVLKVGRTPAAAKAAASHTGSLTGADAVLDAAFRRVGVTRVNGIEDLFDAAEILAKQPSPRGPNLTIVTNAGGPAALATDALVASGGKLAALNPKTLAALEQLLPAAWSHGNPVDILGPANAALYAHATELVLQDPGSDGMLAVLTPQAMTEIDLTASRLCALARTSTKPILASWMGGASLDAARATLNGAGIPTYDYPDSAARAFTLMWEHKDRLRLLHERPALASADVDVDCRRQAAAEVISGVRAAGRVLMTEVESKNLLAAYGIPVTPTLTAHTVEQAVAHAETLGYPVAIKLYSKTITHKSDVGGVSLDVRDAAGVREAWRSIHSSVSKIVGASDFLGVTVQQMAPRGGIELIVGSSMDPQFGPVLLFGAGGEWVEVMKDRAIGFPPLNVPLARRLMEETRVYHALTGARGHAPVDLDALAQLLVSFSQMVAEQRWIAEIDLNPLVVSGGQFLVVDARVVLHPPDLSEDQIPRLAIRPYPVEYVSQHCLDSGTRIVLRPIRPEDETLLVAFHETLSDESVRHRYCGQISLHSRIDRERLLRICFCDYDREIVLVAERVNGPTRQIVGVGRLNRLSGAHEAEFALIVADPWQGQGIGQHLMRKLMEIARKEKLQRISGRILASNTAMLRLCRRLGFQLEGGEASEDFIAVLRL